MNRGRNKSIYEAYLAHDYKEAGIKFTQQYQFCPWRKWKSDFLINGYPLLVEVDGGVWSGGRHTRGKGFVNDRLKDAAAARLGYEVLHFVPEQIEGTFSENTKESEAIITTRTVIAKYRMQEGKNDIGKGSSQAK